MTESGVASSSVSGAQPSFWEDLIDIYFKPADVFRRRQTKSVWAPMLFVAISIGIIFLATYNTLAPIFDAEFTRATNKAIADNPQVTREMMDKMRGYGEFFTKYGVGVIMLVSMFIIGIFTWLVGKLVGARQTFHAALVVAAWAYMPRVLGSVIAGAQGLLMDPAKLTSQMSISLSPARFLDPDTANQLVLQLLGRFDLITLWITVLLAVGMYVTGNVSKPKAAVFGILIWVIGSLPALRQGYMAM